MYRLRALVWFSVVRAHKRAPWEPAAMDRYFLGEGVGDGRAFWRVLRYARDPGVARKDWQGDSLVGRVASTKGFDYTAGVYQSPLWEEVLGPTPLEPARREQLIEQTLERLGLFEPSDDDRLVHSMLGLELDALRSVPARVLRQRVARLARLRSVDCILLLCLYYRRAIEETRLDEARVFAQGALAGIGRFCRRPGVLGGVDSVWTFLTRRRVLAGQRSLAHSPRIQCQAAAWLAPRMERAVARGEVDPEVVEEDAWQLGCVLDNQSDVAPSTAFSPRCADVERYLAQRTTLVEEAMARGLETARSRAQAGHAERSRAQRVLDDLPGHVEHLPPEWS